MTRQWMNPIKGEVINEVATNRQWMSPISKTVVVEAIASIPPVVTTSSALLLGL